jgi:hypothetical protein
LDDSADADDGATDCGPPHPVDRETREEIFGRINGAGEAEARECRQPGQSTLTNRAIDKEDSCAGSRGKTAPTPRMGSPCLAITAAALASATGMRLRGFNSNSKSSTASKTAAMGVLKMADIPPAAPATSSVFLSTAVR